MREIGGYTDLGPVGGMCAHLVDTLLGQFGHVEGERVRSFRAAGRNERDAKQAYQR